MRILLLSLVAVLLVLAGCETTAVNTDAPSAELADVQKKLAAIGYDPGPPDGVMGTRTKKAIQHFQIDADLKPNGNISPEFNEKLEAAHQEYREHERQRQAMLKKRAAVAKGAAPMPLYEIGDAFVWSNGVTETVSRIGGGLVQMNDNGGGEKSLQGHFVLPPQSWAKGEVAGRTEADKTADEAWPLTGNMKSQFSIKAVIQSPGAPPTDEWSGEWRCSSKGREKAPVPAGMFDAHVIQCERKDPPTGGWSRRIWHYVPEINHYVRFLEFIQGSKSRRGKELIAVRPGNEGWPPAALAGLDRAIQESLERGSKGAPVDWSSSAVGGAFRISTTAQRRLSGGIVCRTYLVTREGLGPSRHYPGIACRRGKAGRWLVPGLDQSAIPPERLYKK